MGWSRAVWEGRAVVGLQQDARLKKKDSWIAGATAFSVYLLPRSNTLIRE
jgi:hypothetical protein